MKMRRRLKRQRRASYIPSAGIAGVHGPALERICAPRQRSASRLCKDSWNLKIGLSVIERLIDELEAMG